MFEKKRYEIYINLMKNKYQKFFVTGGAGFIGSFLTESLLSDGYEVTVADNFSTGSEKNLSAVLGHPSLKIETLDVTEDSRRIEKLVEECDVVLHLAAAVGVELVIKEPVMTITSNVKGTENVLLPAAKYRKRIIVASTSEVYGRNENPFFSESDDLRLGPPSRSRWSYACSKLLDEFLLMAYVQKSDLPGTVVRFFNTVGPRQTGQYGMVVPRFVAAALKNETLKVYGDGKQSRCFCHVADVVRAVRLLIDQEGAIGNIYNIGSQEVISMEALARRIIERTHSHSSVELIPYEQAYGQNFDDMRHRCPDTSAIREMTGWQPQNDLDKIIDDVVRSIKEK